MRRGATGAPLLGLLVLGACLGCAGDGGAPSGEVEEPSAAVETPLPTSAPSERFWPPEEARQGGTVAAEIGPGVVHRWKLSLATGDFLRLVVEQEDVDVELRWLDPSSSVVLIADRTIDDRGPELVLVVVEASGEHVLEVIGPRELGAGRYSATIETLRRAEPDDVLAAAAYRRFRAAEALPRDEARAVREETLEVWRQLGEDHLAGEALFRMAGDTYFHREYRETARLARQAAERFARVGDRRWEGLARNRAAVALWGIGEAEASEKAVEEYRAVAAIGREVADPVLEGAALVWLGQAFRRLGEVDQALLHYEAALGVLGEERTLGRAQALHNLGVLHSLYFHDYRRGEELLAAALDSWPEADPAWARRRAMSFNQLGRLALEQEDLGGARRSFEAALELQDASGGCSSAVVLARLALVEEAEGRTRRADARREQAPAAMAGEDCPRSRPTVELLAAQLSERRRDWATALRGFEAASAGADALGDRTTLAEALIGIARVRRAQGQREAALAASGAALDLVERARPKIYREDLRTAFFATVQEHFDLHVALLGELGRHAEAWAAAERARARALQDLLAESADAARPGRDPELLTRERRLKRRLSFVAARAEAEREPDAATLAAIGQEADELLAELERVRAEMRRRDPGYAALTQPEQPTVADVQHGLLDAESILLAFRLGSEASWLWAIGRDGLTAHPLPARSEIEAMAVEAAGWLRSLEWPGRPPPALCELSRLLLAPVADRLADRLVLVLDGALELVPFAALPDPASGACEEAPPLLAEHEVVRLPSSAVLIAQRRRLAGRRAAAGWVAVIADPVYRRDDPRFSRPPRGGESGGMPRLPHAGREAEAIYALAPRYVRRATGFEASKGGFTGEALANHRVLHVAVHGILDAQRPLLSRLALSRFDPRGEPVDGLLHAHEIGGLDLPVELAVLSACETALGRWVAGEGTIAGLPRAFFAAGAARVMVSLWQVPDAGAADLMTAFYRRLLLDGVAPASALRLAQREMWLADRPPREWAGFVLQGDWRPLPPFAVTP